MQSAKRSATPEPSGKLLVLSATMEEEGLSLSAVKKPFACRTALN